VVTSTGEDPGPADRSLEEAAGCTGVPAGREVHVDDLAELVDGRVEGHAVRISLRSYLSSHLLWTARHEAKLAEKIEAAHVAGRTLKGAFIQIMPLTWDSFLLPAIDRHPWLTI
jgi:hypothetical protein